jgi:hypothetical protein
MQLTSLLRTAAKLAVLSALLLPLFPTAQAQTETVLYNLCSIGACFDGASPIGSLTADRYGNFYGTTQSGGSGGCVFVVCVGGAVFQLSLEPASGCPSGLNIGNGWCETVLYNFCSVGYGWPYCPDGEAPYANLTLVPPESHYDTSVGTFYGTTYNGGVGAGCTDSNGCGIAFELSPEPLPTGFGCPSGTNLGNGWCETVLYNFCSLNGCDDGTYPSSGLARDSSGNLYGTTQNGVFELYQSGGVWYETMIYSVFTNSGGLAIDAAGNLYGADAYSNIFKLSRDFFGFWIPTNIYTYTGSPKDGVYPGGTPAVDSAGNVYGTTEQGGAGTKACASGCGTVWKLTLVTTGKEAGTYKERILHSFTSEKTGYYPQAGVTLDSSGNIYGTTTVGGNYATQCVYPNLGNGCGTVFELAVSGETYKYKLLWSFNGTDGEFPFDNPTLDSSGNLYGTTYEGGASYNGGAVFEVTP